MTASYDLVIVGGGINGAAIARDAAGRGCSVLLCEQGDLGSGTSSMSSKLIHGGLRYLEQFEFRLVREALRERETLLRAAPHVVHPLRFVLPHNSLQRPAWQIRIGLFLYDHMGARRRLPGSRKIDLRRDVAGQALRPEFTVGFEYADCRTDDSRLVILNALDAAQRGAVIRPRTRCTAARRDGAQWTVTLQPRDGGDAYPVTARVLVNAAGPWIADVTESALHLPRRAPLRLVKGSHLLFPRLYEGEHAYILQHPDGRVVFTIPFLDRYTLVGTTDQPYRGDPAAARLTEEEGRYLCDAVNRYLRRPVDPAEAVWNFSGVRPLFEDQVDNPSAVSRDYALELDREDGGAPVLSVIGGKLTVHREVAEQALDKLAPFLPGADGHWSRGAVLPGGDLPGDGLDAYLALFREARPWLPEAMARRLVYQYGQLAERVLGEATSLTHLGRHFGAHLYEAEVRYLVSHEWALTAEDIVWRRSKLGLALGEADVQSLEEWLSANRPGSAPGN